MDLRTGAPFWPTSDGLIAVYPPLERDERCDVAIIGAGITGALAAHRLAQAGCDVVMLDRHDVGMGSTAASTGLLQCETDTSLGELAAELGIERAVRSWRLGLEAIDDLQIFCADPAYGFARRPTLYLASTKRDVKTLRAEHALRAAHGFDVVWLDRAEIAARFGFDAHGAIESRGDAEIDAYRLTHGLIDEAVGKGARVYDRTNVNKVRVDRCGVTLTTNRGATVRARRLVVAAGYEVARQLRQDRGHLHSTWALASEPVADLSWWPDRCLIWETRRPYLYLRTTRDGRVMMGGEDEPWSSRHENTRLLVRKTGRLLKGFSRLFPKVRLEVAYAWAGVFGTTPDGLPCIGTIPDHLHTFYALGYGGNGITFSVIAANLVRDWWSGRPNADAAIFAFDRWKY
jgi:glycine/D-amino acid oxidase-like deaminating enzyme